jgi:phosphohistidine phosphatase
MTIRFFLVRHGRAEARHPQGDAARRLLPEGRAEFAAHARALAHDLTLARIATSPYARAVETAALLSDATGAAVEEDGALGSGESDGRGLLRHGRLLGDRSALVGHNPEIGEAISLAAGRQIEVPPGAIAAIDEDRGEFHVAWVRAPGAAS